MAVDALITAGGKGTRMRELGMEKPMVPLRGRPLIGHVLEAVRSSGYIGEVHASVSDNTPLTREHLKGLEVRVIETSGMEYCQDLQDALRTIGTDHVLICPADVPLITIENIDRLIVGYLSSGVESYSVAVPCSILQEIGVRPSYRFTVNGVDTALCGISVVDRRKMISGALLSEGYMIMGSPDLALNINTLDDLRAAEKILGTRTECSGNRYGRTEHI